MSSFSSSSPSRRVFMLQVVTASAGVLAASQASAQAMVDEKDPKSAALGYKADASKVDKAKHPKMAAGAKCGNCALFGGKADASAGSCPLFAGKQVSAQGWCASWVKKA